MMTFRCSRCGREAESRGKAGPHDLLPAGWSHGGWLADRQETEVVCDGCQFAEWVPHCASVVDLDGELIDVEALRAAGHDVDASMVRWCDFVDLSVSFDDDHPPESWTCPRCGGHSFEGVKRDYLPDGPGGWSRS